MVKLFRIVLMTALAGAAVFAVSTGKAVHNTTPQVVQVAPVPVPTPHVAVDAPQSVSQQNSPGVTYDWLNLWVAHNPLGWFFLGFLAKGASKLVS
jgi:hypothetical protein